MLGTTEAGLAAEPPLRWADQSPPPSASDTRPQHPKRAGVAPCERRVHSVQVRFVRFVVHDLDGDSGYRQGFIQAAARLDDDGHLADAQAALFRESLRWFREHLPVPDRFTRTRNASHKKKRALSWFKEDALAQITHARDVLEIPRSHDVLVEKLVTERPGYVVYEDDFQVVAEPFTDTPTFPLCLYRAGGARSRGGSVDR
jgi:hypothetical protein